MNAINYYKNLDFNTQPKLKFQNQSICKIYNHIQFDTHRLPLVMFQELKHFHLLEGSLYKLGFHAHKPHHMDTNEEDRM